MSETRRVLVGNIPCYIQDQAGPLSLGLVFRVGWADEWLHQRGITHCVEHLALHESARARLMMNGFVEANQTSFVVHGAPDEVTQFVDSVCRSLRRLPVDRLEAEARVLRTEGAGRSPSVYSSLLANRFGSAGYGLAAYPELGLISPQPGVVQQWCDYWFTSDNVVMWATGELPSGLRVDLPSGHHFLPPAPQPLPWRLPGRYHDGDSLVGVSFLVRRSDAATLATRILERRAYDRLRMAQASSYQVSAMLDYWTVDWCHGMLAADSLPDHADQVVEGLLAELGRLATIPPDPSELQEQVADATRQWNDPAAAVSLAASAASSELIGRPVRSTDEALAAYATVTPEDIRVVVSEMLDSSIIQLPRDANLGDRRFVPIPLGSDSAVEGQHFARFEPFNDGYKAQHLLVGHSGVTLVHSDELKVTVAQSELAAYQRWSDGARTIWGRDGLHIYLHPGEWIDGVVAIEMIDRTIPPHLIVEMGQEAGSRYLEEVSRLAAERASEKGGLFKRRRRG